MTVRPSGPGPTPTWGGVGPDHSRVGPKDHAGPSQDQDHDAPRTYIEAVELIHLALSAPHLTPEQIATVIVTADLDAMAERIRLIEKAAYERGVQDAARLIGAEDTEAERRAFLEWAPTITRINKLGDYDERHHIPDAPDTVWRGGAW